MALNLTTPLRKALHQLEAEKQRIDREIAAIRAALAALGDKRGRILATAPRAKARKHGMSLAARRAVSRRMKAYWAKRRAAPTKRQGRGTQKAE